MSRQEWLKQRKAKLAQLEELRTHLRALGTASIEVIRQLAQVNTDIVTTKTIINNINSNQPTHGHELPNEQVTTNEGRKA